MDPQDGKRFSMDSREVL